ncbi:exostosin-like 3 isoform X1 [Lampetra fluviatilis]
MRRGIRGGGRASGGSPGRPHCGLLKLACALLALLVAVPLVAHYYLALPMDALPLSSLRLHAAGPCDALPHLPAGPDLPASELCGLHEEVSEQLVSLEARRRGLSSELARLMARIEAFRLGVEAARQELAQLRHVIAQTERAYKELLEQAQPRLALPAHVAPGPSRPESLAPPAHPYACRMHSCFDHSRCPLTAGFSAHAYPPGDYPALWAQLEPLARHAFREHATNASADARAACVFLVLVGPLRAGLPVPPATDVERQLRALPHWLGDGRNHLLVHLSLAAGDRSALGTAADTGRALLVGPCSEPLRPRPGFDLVLPPVAHVLDEPDPLALTPHVPAARRHSLAFRGAAPEDRSGLASALRVQWPRGRDGALLDFACGGDAETGGGGTDWALCGSRDERLMLLRVSTFALVPLPEPAGAGTLGPAALVRLSEALEAGAVPVLLGGDAPPPPLPLADVIDWRQATVLVARPRATELRGLLRGVSEADVLALRRQGRFLWRTYLAGAGDVLRSALAAVRTRLQLPPPPAPAAPAQELPHRSGKPPPPPPPPSSDLDQAAGPVAEGPPLELGGMQAEPPYASPSFLRNFTAALAERGRAWNSPPGPFLLFPFTPWDPQLPSEAQFLGSGAGFRPIAGGAGGSGREFQEALGGNVAREQFTVLMPTYERDEVLMRSLERLNGLPYLHKVIVVWNSPGPPAPELLWPDIGVPILVVRTERNSLNNRFLPYDAIHTEAILSIDDDAHLRHDEIIFGFRVWREARDRIVGFPGRYHAWDAQHGSWLYNSNYSCELSMVLTGAAFFHKYYAYLYTLVMPQAIRDLVDEFTNCEDIAMNFLVSHITQKPPIKVTSRWTFRCPSCPQALSQDESHFVERHRCMAFLVRVYGYMPLLHTQHRADSVLFKTRLPHDKTKCFKFI